MGRSMQMEDVNDGASVLPMQLEDGDSFDCFRLIRRISSSQKSEIWVAENEKYASTEECHLTAGIPEYVVLKATWRGSEEEVDRAHHEANIMRQLNHPNIIRIYGEYEDSDYYVIIMECFCGTTLRDYAISNNGFTRQREKQILQKVGFAVEYMHAHGIAHSDLNPNNILIDDEGEGVKIIDFDLAVTCTNRDRVGMDSDMWGLGGLLYYLLFGKDLMALRAVPARLPCHLDTETADMLGALLGAHAVRLQLADVMRMPYWEHIFVANKLTVVPFTLTWRIPRGEGMYDIATWMAHQLANQRSREIGESLINDNYSSKELCVLDVEYDVNAAALPNTVNNVVTFDTFDRSFGRKRARVSDIVQTDARNPSMLAPSAVRVESAPEIPSPTKFLADPGVRVERKFIPFAARLRRLFFNRNNKKIPTLP